MELKDYKAKKENIIKAINLIREEIKDERVISFLEDKIKNLENDKFIISVFGHFSNGKSSFLNVLMGFSEEILIEDELASTAAITRLKYPTSEDLKNKAEIIFNNGEVKLVEFNEIKKYSTRNANFNVENEISEVILYIDTEILKDGVEIVDTPGFNSTHAIHTDIAKAHVANSDASIFLFSYDKPGSKKEFEFLRDVNDKMERIFIILNKIDLEDRTESTIEDTINDLKNKICSFGADVRSKEIYPVSARVEKIAISEDDDSKRKESRVLKFKKKLESYLTSSDNISDRLEAPIKSILSMLNQCREIKREEQIIYNTESENINNNIKKAKNELEELEKELRERKKSIKKSIKCEINNSRSKIESNVEVLESEIDEDLKDVKSSFELKTIDFEDMTNGIYNKIKKTVESTQRELVGNIEEIIDSYIDDEKEVDYIKQKLINAIEIKLNIDSKKEIEINDIDKSYLKDIDDEIKNKKEELDNIRQQWEKSSKELEENEQLSFIVTSQRKELERLKNERNERLLNIGDGQARIIRKTKETTEKRKGFFGAIATVCVGDKVKISEEEVYDYSEVKEKERRKANIRNEYYDDIKHKEIEVEFNQRNLKGKSAERIQQEIELEFIKVANKFSEEEMKFQKEKYEREQQLVTINLRKYKKTIKAYISDIVEDVKINLDANIKYINKIVELSLTSFDRKINEKNELLENLIFSGKSSPEELDIKRNEILNEIVILNKSIESIRTIKENMI